MGNSGVRQYPFMRIWIDSPHTISTHLGVADAEAQLRGKWRYDEGRMKILVRTGRARDEYVIIAQRKNFSSAFQRFFYSRLVVTEEGAALVGVIRTPGWARGILTGAFAVWF